uniref:Uncharacterized protein LOC103449610 isoform X2 n=1 Tax=Rhizophora mucronata TaxID=61149 RepID=A0A2P2MFI5_RHIMU
MKVRHWLKLKFVFRKNCRFPMKSFPSGNLLFCHWVALSTFKILILCPADFRSLSPSLWHTHPCT